MRTVIPARPARSRATTTTLLPARGFGAPAVPATGGAGHDFSRIAVSAPVQRSTRDDAPAHGIRQAAREGVRTPSAALPFAAAIRRAFGRHPVDGIRAHVGESAGRSATAMRADAFATGEHVVFGRAPDLRTAAHEAAHVVQQRAGVRPPGGIGREGDRWERHADAVADAVVAGRSAEPLLAPFAASRTIRSREPSSSAPFPASPSPAAAGAAHPGAAVQRVLKVGGQDVDLNALLQGRDADEQRVLNNWAGSGTVHDFTDHGKLHEALQGAKDQPPEPSALYDARNLKFLTQTQNGGRLPTLYFKSGIRSARIRQQHPSGPAVIKQKNKKDYFFSSRNDLDEFHRKARRAKRHGLAFKPIALKRRREVSYSPKPSRGAHHYEVTFNDDATVKKLHKSQGLVAFKGRGYNAQRVRAIYRRATGHES